MKLEFTKYTEVTTRAKEIKSDFFKEYEKVFVCPDVHNFWISKILVGYNENYEKQDDCVLIERNNIDDYTAHHLKIFSPETLVDMVIKADSEDGCSWDALECDSVEDAINQLEDGFEIFLEDDTTL